MKKNILGKKLQRDKNERKALFKGLMSSLILHDSIKTSEAKAKAIKPQIERLVTKAKSLTNASTQIIRESINPNAVDRFLSDIAPRFKDRNGGYTRIIKLGKRLGDKSQIVILEWVEMSSAVATVPQETAKNVKANPPANKAQVKSSKQKSKPKKTLKKVIKK